MTRVIKAKLASENDSLAARSVATRLASLLNSKVLANSRVVIGEAFCPCQVPFHTKDFYCFVYVSDDSYRFTAQCRSRPVADFFVSLKEPANHMFAKTRSPVVSKRLRVPVFRQPFLSDSEIESALLSSRVLPLLEQVRFAPISEFHFSPAQLTVSSSLGSPERCVKQALLFRDLIGAAFADAHERSKRNG